jgi:membrane associated rhomboid family serine protease
MDSVTVLLIILTSVVSLYALYSNPQLLQKGMLRPYYTVRNGQWYQLITSGFLHAGTGHLLVNMFTLFFFGTTMERSLGVSHFIALYFFSQIISALPSLLKYQNDPSFASLGASGAVEGVLFAFIMLYPFRSIYLFLIPIPIPAFLFGVLFIAYSIYENKQDRGVINHEAHIAGAMAGIVYMMIMVPSARQHILRTLGLG